MPLTQAQSKEEYIVRSLMAYLKDKVVVPYNIAVADTNYSFPLGIELEWPDDPAKSPKMPVIIIDEPVDSRNQMGTGMGDRIVYKYKQFRLYCFPAITAENKPSLSAAATLRNYLDFALGTGLYIPIYDYGANPVVQSEAARVDDSRIIRVGAHVFSNLLSIEKHRFDYILTLCYPVETIGG